MPRRIVKRKWQGAMAGKIAPAALRWLLFGEPTGRDEAGVGDYFQVRFMGDGAPWSEHRDAILEQWIAERPGTRPYGWWGDGLVPRAEERRKVAGSGKKTCSIDWDRTTTYFDCDPSDPPAIESEASFLKRLGLLEPGEEKRVPRSAWRPVRLDVEADGWAPADDAEDSDAA